MSIRNPTINDYLFPEDDTFGFDLDKADLPPEIEDEEDEDEIDDYDDEDEDFGLDDED